MTDRDVRPMSHFRAKRLLAQVLDHTLPAPVEAAVRAHAERCGRCAGALAEHEHCEALLARLPATMVPVEPSTTADARLRGLARWAADPRPSLVERVSVAALGTAVAATMLVLVWVGQGWAPPTDGLDRTPTTLAVVLPGHAAMPAETQLMPGRGMVR